MPTELVDVEDFLGHSGQSKGGNYANWRDPKRGGRGYIDVWLSRRCAVSVALWRHPFLRYDTTEDPQTRDPVRVLKYTTLLCPEAEATLQMQGRHSRETGQPLVPYASCPVHKMLEWLFQAVRAGELGWLQEVFRFDAGDGKPRSFCAAGLYGIKEKDVGPKEEREMNKAGFYMKTVFQQKWMAQLNYVFRVVDNDNPKAGILTAIESNSLGDHMKAKIREAMAEPPLGLGKELGNPIRNPACFRWQNHPTETDPSKKYSASRFANLRPSEEILHLITEQEPPGIDQLTQPPLWASVRANLENAACVDLPFDDWFPQAGPEDDKKVLQRQAHEVQGHPNGAPPSRQAPPRTVQAPPAGASPQPPPQARSRAAQGPQSMAEVPRVQCDNLDCDAMLLATEATCAKCGVSQPNPMPQPAQPPPPRRRSEASAGPRSAQSAPVGNPGFQPPPRQAPPPQPPPQRRPPAQQSTQGFDDFPKGGDDSFDFGANAADAGELEPLDELPWGRR
jgi:hypothetical protein